MHARRCEPVIARMRLKREIPEPIEQRDAENVSRQSSSGAILRKRISWGFRLVVSTLLLTAYVYHRSTYLGRTDWHWFWLGEAIVGVLVVVGIVQILRKTQKL
jgi:hypothetical protein